MENIIEHRDAGEDCLIFAVQIFEECKFYIFYINSTELVHQLIIHFNRLFNVRKQLLKDLREKGDDDETTECLFTNESQISNTFDFLNEVSKGKDKEEIDRLADESGLSKISTDRIKRQFIENEELSDIFVIQRKTAIITIYK